MYFNFIRAQYQLGKLTDAQVHAFVPKYITEEQYLEITGQQPSGS